MAYGFREGNPLLSIIGAFRQEALDRDRMRENTRRWEEEQSNQKVQRMMDNNHRLDMLQLEKDKQITSVRQWATEQNYNKESRRLDNKHRQDMLKLQRDKLTSADNIAARKQDREDAKFNLEQILTNSSISIAEKELAIKNFNSQHGAKIDLMLANSTVKKDEQGIAESKSNVNNNNRKTDSTIKLNTQGIAASVQEQQRLNESHKNGMDESEFKIRKRNSLETAKQNFLDGTTKEVDDQIGTEQEKLANAEAVIKRLSDTGFKISASGKEDGITFKQLPDGSVEPQAIVGGKEKPFTVDPWGDDGVTMKILPENQQEAAAHLERLTQTAIDAGLSEEDGRAYVRSGFYSDKETGITRVATGAEQAKNLKEQKLRKPKNLLDKVSGAVNRFSNRINAKGNTESSAMHSWGKDTKHAKSVYGFNMKVVDKKAMITNQTTAEDIIQAKADARGKKAELQMRGSQRYLNMQVTDAKAAIAKLKTEKDRLSKWGSLYFNDKITETQLQNASETDNPDISAAQRDRLIATTARGDVMEGEEYKKAVLENRQLQVEISKMSNKTDLSADDLTKINELVVKQATTAAQAAGDPTDSDYGNIVKNRSGKLQAAINAVVLDKTRHKEDLLDGNFWNHVRSASDMAMKTGKFENFPYYMTGSERKYAQQVGDELASSASVGENGSLQYKTKEGKLISEPVSPRSITARFNYLLSRSMEAVNGEVNQAQIDLILNQVHSEIVVK